MGRGIRGRGLHRVRGPRRPLRRSDVRRLHQARRHGDVPRACGPGTRARTQPRRPRSVVVRGGARPQPPLLSARLAASPRDRLSADGTGRRLALPAAAGVPRGAPRPRPVPARGARDRLSTVACDRRGPRRAGGAALRLCALGRGEGARRRAARRAGRGPGRRALPVGSARPSRHSARRRSCGTRRRSECRRRRLAPPDAGAGRVGAGAPEVGAAGRSSWPASPPRW